MKGILVLLYVLMWIGGLAVLMYFYMGGSWPTFWKSCVSNSEFNKIMEDIFTAPDYNDNGARIQSGKYMVSLVERDSKITINGISDFSWRQKSRFLKRYRKERASRELHLKEA